MSCSAPVTVGTALAGAAAVLRVRERAGERPGAARFDARRLLADVLGRTTAWLLAHDDAPLPAADAARFSTAVARRLRGEPVAYIVGTAGFYGRLFAVDARVLVPRPETEGVVAAALAHLGFRAGPLRLCDVGTGSGCLAVTLACELPAARVTALDLSVAALAVARRNAEALGVAQRLDFHAGDGLASLPAGERFDAIVANLPYVKHDELPAPPDPASFEPRLALDGGPDGLVAYRALLAEAPARLAAGGALIMEAGPETAAALAYLSAGAFPAASVAILPDDARLARLVVVRDERARS